MNPYPNFGPAQPYPSQGFLDSLKALPTTAKVLITGALAVVGAIIIVAISAATHDHGPAAFLDELHDAGFYNRGGDAAELDDGYMICDWLSAGYSHDRAADSFFRYSPKLSHSDATKYVNITDDYLC